MEENKPAEHAEEKKGHKIEHKEALPAGGRHMSERKGVVLFSILGAIIGYISYALNNPLMSLVITIIVVAVSYLALTKALKLAEPKKWWSNKIVLYVFMWLVVWTILFNVFTVKAL